MAIKKIMFRVLLSSASDVAKERDIVSKIVDEVNEVNKDKLFGIELFRWENDVFPSMKHDDGQITIDKKFNYKHADLLIGLFYKKLGDGTVHEIDEAMQIKNEYGLLDIKLYFKKVDKNLLSETEEDGYRKLLNKQKEYMKRGIVGTFNTEIDFEQKIRKHIYEYFDNAKKPFLRECTEEKYNNTFILESPEVKINSFKMCYFRNEINKGMSFKELANRTGISTNKLSKLEKIHRTDDNWFFPSCTLKELLEIEKALSINFGSMIATSDIYGSLLYKQFYDTFKAPSSNKMNKYKYKVIIFDFDGTLADAKQMKTTWQKIWTELGYDLKICQDLHRRFDHNKITHQEWCDMTADYFIKKHMNKSVLIDVAKTIRLIEGFDEAISILVKNNISLYIVSGSIKEVINIVLGEKKSYFRDISANEMLFDNNDLLSKINGTHYDFDGKAEYVRKIINNNNLSPKQVLFIGNSFNDAHVYKSGCRTLCVNPHLTNSHNTKYWHDSIDDMNNLNEILPFCLGE